TYDRFGEQGLRGGPGSPGFGGFDFADAIEVFMRDFGGFAGFEEIFGGRRGGGRGREAGKGQTLRVRLPLTLKDVSTGVTKKIRVALLDSCETCKGSGAAPGSNPVPCRNCGGSGEERQVQRSVFGQFVSVAPCRVCGGEGRIVETPCESCRGEGRVRKETELDVEVPPGVSSENFLTLRGQGSAGPRGGPKGDIIVLLEVQDDARFKRDGENLLYELPITFTQAALGDQVEVPTVDGTVRLTVPPGIQSGEVLRMRGQGLPGLHGRGKGDQLVRVRIWTPQKLSKDQERILQELRQEEDPPPEDAGTGEDRGFWSRVKEAFS
ncbi:MAG: molecular chaperone DnaJ, partial [Gemmatimonadetes bacterium]|nr:molecular chaperone DnaJ [Gemmatimonadota bacterium]